MENSTFQLIFGTQFKRVDKVAVMRNGHRSLYMAYYDWLCVVGIESACGGITHMTDGNSASAELCKLFRVEYFVYQTYSLVIIEHAAVVYNDAAAFLSPVLKCIESEIS